jgi:MobA-like NTP transferase domain
MSTRRSDAEDCCPMSSSSPTHHDAASRTLPPLLLLAAGIGSRYGGVKPLAPVGTDEMPLLLVSMHQAAAAGFTEAIVVTGPLTHDPIVEAITTWGSPLAVRYASQSGFGPPRKKPWGTVAALLAGADDRGVVIANGDDLYGRQGFNDAVNWWRRNPPGVNGALVAYRLGPTVNAVGAVNRGVAEADDRGRLVRLREHRGVEASGDGYKSDLEPFLPADSLASMNLWVLEPKVLTLLRAVFDRFLETHQGDESSECLLPLEIGELVNAGHIAVDVVPTLSTWMGVTYADDVAGVRAALAAAP